MLIRQLHVPHAAAPAAVTCPTGRSRWPHRAFFEHGHAIRRTIPCRVRDLWFLRPFALTGESYTERTLRQSAEAKRTALKKCGYKTVTFTKNTENANAYISASH
jgi:hypothetical protein